MTSCKAFVERLKTAGRDVVLTEYPDSAHGFDSGLLGVNTVAVSANAQTVRNCHIKEGDGGVLMNGDTQRALHLQGRLRRAQPACRRQSRHRR